MPPITCFLLLFACTLCTAAALRPHVSNRMLKRDTKNAFGSNAHALHDAHVTLIRARTDTNTPTLPREPSPKIETHEASHPVEKEEPTVEISKESADLQAANRPYKYGFTTEVEKHTLPPGINEERIREISALKHEPDWLLDFRLSSFNKWAKMDEPDWSALQYDRADYQKLTYYSAPKNLKKHAKLEDVDPKILETFEKLGIPLSEQKRLTNTAVDAVFDSVSIATTFKEQLEKEGVVFCSISEAVEKYPHLVRKYLGSVVPPSDNFFAALNGAVFSDGTFVYVPENVTCPMDLSTYFRINDKEAGQFERTLIIADRNSKVTYLEGCTAPAYSSNQLHAAVVELVALDGAEIKYSTVQNWYSGDPHTGKGGVYNFVTKRGRCKGEQSKISWTQLEAGSAVTWKYPSCILEGDGSTGEFYSVALTNGRMQADTGTKMIHVGKNTKSRIISKGIAADESVNIYRGLVLVSPKASGAKSYTKCDSMLIGSKCVANTFPVIQSTDPRRHGDAVSKRDRDAVSGDGEEISIFRNPTRKNIDFSRVSLEHEATTARIKETQMQYLQSRGLSEQDVISLLTTGFCTDVLSNLPMEFAMEADKLLQIKLENVVG